MRELVALERQEEIGLVTDRLQSCPVEDLESAGLALRCMKEVGGWVAGWLCGWVWSWLWLWSWLGLCVCTRESLIDE